jgi:hypothetical protein
MDVPDVISQVELRGSRAEKLKTLNASIARLEALRAALAGDASAPVPPPGFMALTSTSLYGRGLPLVVLWVAGSCCSSWSRG